MKYLAFNSPMFTDKEPYCNCISLITFDDAVAYIVRNYKEHRPDDDYDYGYMAALEDFKAVWWAWEVEIPDGVFKNG